MKVIIKKLIEVDGVCKFNVYADNDLISSHHFKPGQSDESIWNEEKNLNKALEIAKKLEAGQKKIEEVVYQTPDPQQE